MHDIAGITGRLKVKLPLKMSSFEYKKNKNPVNQLFTGFIEVF